MSNVYPVDPDIFMKIRKTPRRNRTIDDYETVHKFLDQIRGKSALKKIANYVYGVATQEKIYEAQFKELGISKWQRKLFWDLDTPCAYAQSGHNPHGLIAKGTIACKCRNHACRYFDKNINKCGA